MTSSDDSQTLEAVAIVGMSGRFPGARGLEEFWRNLKDGVESIRFFSDKELADAGVPPQVLADPAYVKAKAELADIDLFDAGLFGFTPREAEIADPQRRIFLECVWEALDDAGYDPARYRGDIGLYGGASMNTYLINNLLSNRRIVDAMGLLQTAIFNRNDHLTTHTAYTLNLKGPSVTVQTTCSTSLVAVHMACQALISYQCDMALAGGVAVSVPNRAGYLYQEGGIGSADGHCRAFDARANGTVSGSGAGVVVLKRLADALEDRDCIRAVIRSTAINNDGAEKIGYTAPSVAGQAQVIAMAQAIAGISSERISYIECHGTGTPLGDPIEIEALSQVFRRSTARKGFCSIGSVKSNIGHLDTAAGIAGLIKTTLALQHRQLPASLHFNEPNPRIDFDNSPFRVNAALNDWQSDGRSRMAGVSSFGIGGTNAHVIVEEAPPGAPRPSPPRPHLLTFSARTKSALNVVVANLADHLQRNPQQDLGDVAYTLQVGRRALGQRCTFVCRDREDALSVLAMSDVGRMASGAHEAAKRPVAFMFPGQGSQYVNAAVELYESEEVFRREIDRCSQLLRPYLDCPLQELLFASSECVAQAGEKLQQTAYAQPALFAIEYALARLFMDWGVQPQAMIGHSVGEYVAACLSGVFSLEDGLKLVAARGRLMQTLPGGSMLSVSLPENELRARLSHGLEIAAINSPSLCVVAGRDEAVAAFEAELIEQGVGCLRLRTSHAFHSSMMEPILEEFLQVFDTVELQAPSSPCISTLTGAWITAAEATSPAYWARHLRHTVQFGKGLGVLFEDPNWILLEVGPGRMLMSMARRHPQKAAAQMVLHSLPPPDSRRSSAEIALMTLGQLWASGVEPEWDALHRRDPRGRVPLPSYPFERQRYWIEARTDAAAASDSLARDPDLSKWLYAPSWKRAVQRSAPTSVAPEGASWLFFADDVGVAARMAESVRPIARSVVSVIAAQGFAKLAPLQYALDPTDPKGYLRLFEELERENLLPERIVHAYGIGLPDSGQSAPASFYSLLYLAQALGMDAAGRSIHIDIVVANGNEVTGAETLHPEQAMLAGPALVIPQEYAGVTCRLIDLDFAEVTGREGAGLPDSLLEELREPDTQSVAYRNGHRWVQFFERVVTESGSATPFRLRQDGVYLITGGLGGMGLTMADYLARQLPGVKLALMGRAPLPPREHWDEWIRTHGEDERESAVIAALRALEAQGAQAIYFSADVSDSARLGEIVADINERFGPITGLVHTAGVPGNGLIQLKTAEKADQVLAAKVQGTRALYAVLSGQPLDFSILCSSRSALFGGVGSMDYCSANAYLDAFAQSRRKTTGEFVVSVNWPAWQEVGMLVDAHRVRREPVIGTEELVGHPLVERHVARGRDRHVFRSRLAVKTHWVLDEHRILGTAVLAGVNYLEMARAAFGKAVQAGPVELGDVYFLTPLRVQDDESRDIRLVLERAGEGYDFYVESAPSAEADGTAEWVRHVIGKIAALPTEPARKIDIAGLITECDRDELRLTDENFFDESLGPRWHCVNHLHRGDGRLLAELRLSDEHRGDLDLLHLHPALLDRAAGIGLLFLVENSGKGYLPFGYGKLRLYAPFQQRMYVYSKGGADPATDAETTIFDVDILAEDGTLLAQIRKFAHKRINELGKAVNALMAGHQRGDEAAHTSASVARDSAHAEQATPFERVLSLGISPDEGAQVFARMLGRKVPAQVVVSPSDLATVIQWARQSTLEHLPAEAGQLPALEMHARPGLETTFVAPISELECRLATLWQECLGIDRIGLHDDFFELGGNSVLAIQIMANAKKAGLNFSVQQLFQYPTVAELATRTESSDAGAADAHGGGALPSLPAQRRFFQADAQSSEPAAWSLLLEIDPCVDPAMLERHLAQLLTSHDALRLHFPANLSPGTPAITATAAEGALEVVDMRDVAPADRAAYVLAAAARARAELRIGSGPLAKFVLFHANEGEISTLLLAVHPIAADPGSARILIEALRSAIDPVAHGGRDASVQAPRYRKAVASAFEFARSPVASKEFGYWETMRGHDAAAWPGANANGATEPAQRALHSVSLSREDTRTLMDDAPRAYRARTEEFVLAALVKVLSERTGERALRIDCNGRLDALAGESLREVVGPFATVAPVAFEKPADDDPGVLLTAIKEQWRAAPRGGASYDLLRSLRDEPAPADGADLLPNPSIGFAYLGEFDDPQAAASVRMHPSMPPAGFDRPERAEYAISVRAFVYTQRLHLRWSFDPARVDRDTAVALASAHCNEIRVLARYCAAADAEVFTPSDFPLADLDSKKLQRILKLLE